MQERLDIPVFHDDQHGTAIVVTAAFLNALKLVGKRAEDVRVVMTGVGAAGVAVTDMLLGLGVREHHRLRPPGRDLSRPRRPRARSRQLFAEQTNPEGFAGTADEALARRRRLHRPLRPGRGHAATASPRWRPTRSSSRWRTRPPRCSPEEIEGLAAVIATGRSDYPNQINNVLAFPGVFRGALDVRASAINEEMKLAAAHAIAAVVKPDELSPEYIVPSVFNRDVAPAVAAAVAAAAEAIGRSRAAPQGLCALNGRGRACARPRRLVGGKSRASGAAARTPSASRTSRCSSAPRAHLRACSASCR